MSLGGTTKWLDIGHAHLNTMLTGLLPPLREVFRGEHYLSTNVDRASWKSLIDGSSLQLNCNREGYNVNIKWLSVRLGILANDQIECVNSESVIGFGHSLGSCENYVHANKRGDNGKKGANLLPFCYILLK